MKIKNSILAILIAFAFTTCDKVDGPYREKVVVGEFCTTGIQDSVVHKKVLVEDYTGHLCGNCPEAGVFLNDTLKALYQHCLVVISVHAGYYAGTCPTAFACPGNQPAGAFTTDFNTAPGSAWNTFFGISANPKGMIDRIDYPANHSKTISGWAPAVATELADTAKASVKITNTYNSGSNSVSVAVESKFIYNVQGNQKLQVVLTEDSLIDWQEWYNHNPTYVPDYIHHHVLRDVINTTWGEDIVTGSASAGFTITKNYSYAINSAWNVNHCNVVAFIYDATTYKVLQVEEAAVK